MLQEQFPWQAKPEFCWTGNMMISLIEKWRNNVKKENKSGRKDNNRNPVPKGLYAKIKNQLNFIKCFILLP